MPLEHDDEATSFDPRPWGAQQRILPRSNFTRMSGTLQETSIPQIPELMPVRAIPPLPIPVAGASTALGTPLGVPVVHAPVQPPYMPAISFAPLAMPAFTAQIDSTLRVHRPPLTLRSFIAVPLGALVAILMIAVGYRASTIRPPGAAVAGVAVALAPIAEAPVLVASVPVLAPLTPPPIEGVATFDAPIEVERTIPVEAKSPAPAKPARTSPRKHRPRKIVAVDSSTPLGNLRPRRY